MASETQSYSNGQGHDQAPLAPAPPIWLRPVRAVVGMALLALAWGVIMLAFWLAEITLAIPSQSYPYVRIGLYVLGALGTCWLGIAALAAVLVGAFSLMLALTSRSW